MALKVLACLGKPQDWFGLPVRDIPDDDVLRWEWVCIAAQEFLGLRKPPKPPR